jgi:hypothetical protein
MGARGEAHVGLQDYARLQRGPAGVGGALQTESKRTVHRLLQAAVGPRHHAADSGNSPSTTAPGARTVFAQNTNLDKAAGCNAKFSRVALPPGTPLTLHVAAVSSEFFVAAKGCESSRRTVGLVGATLTLTCVAGGSGVGGGGEGGRKDSPSPAHPSAPRPVARARRSDTTAAAYEQFACPACEQWRMPFYLQANNQRKSRALLRQREKNFAGVSQRNYRSLFNAL